MGVVVQIEKCLRASLKSKSKKILMISDKEGEEEGSRLRSELISAFGHPHCWADPVDFGTPRLFINVKPTGNWTAGNKSVLLWVDWRQPAGSLKEMCLEAIKESLSTRDEVIELGLPRVLEANLCSLF